MTDFDVLERAGALMGATLVKRLPSKNPNWKDCWVATVYGDKAAAIMRAILPYMGRRRTIKILDMLKVNASKISYAEAGRRSARKKKERLLVVA